MKQRGFSLIELMIAVAIIAIIALVAIPGYQESLLKSRRADGQIALSMMAQRLERCYTQFGRYDATQCEIESPQPSPDGFYTIAISARTANSWSLEATPQGPQEKDLRCASLQLNHMGVKGATGTHPAEC